ncbi:40S ribosomal protein SA [Glycine soja]|uniref:40S ribosomal protein SA n=1 Tax=Glycine soja TaxID=3848 RepID=A0A445KZ55_GLYSO|nr:40S ribosomal protein SA [Glycine soja]
MATATNATVAPPRQLSQKEVDIQMMLAVDVHLDTKNCNFQMEHYIFKRHNDGIYIINLGKTWEKLQLAARDATKEEKTEDVKVLAFVTTKASDGCEDIVYNPNENLQHWLTDAKARDQFVIRVGSDTEVLWNDARHLKPDPVYKHATRGSSLGRCCKL